MTPDRILVMRGPGETRAALLAGEELLDVVHVRDAEPQPGAVYAVRVGEKHPATRDFFADLGVGVAGLVDNKAQPPPVGQMIAAVVAASSHGDKGPKLKRSTAAIPQGLTAPGLITPAPDPVIEWWRRHGETIETIRVTPRAEARRWVKALGPDAPVEAATDEWALFDAVDEQIEVGLSKTVKLPGGGRLIIEHTSALTAVDIDAGSSPVAVANEQAMSALARQLRLRNIAGHVVVDLIPHPNRAKFLKLLREACAADPNDPQIRGFTPSGMIDVVRRRTRASLAETLLDGAGKMNARAGAYRALRTACREMTSRRTAQIELAVSSDVARLLNEGLRPALDEAQSLASGRIAVTAHASFFNDRIELASI